MVGHQPCHGCRWQATVVQIVLLVCDECLFMSRVYLCVNKRVHSRRMHACFVCIITHGHKFNASNDFLCIAGHCALVLCALSPVATNLMPAMVSWAQCKSFLVHDGDILALPASVQPSFCLLSLWFQVQRRRTNHQPSNCIKGLFCDKAENSCVLQPGNNHHGILSLYFCVVPSCINTKR